MTNRLSNSDWKASVTQLGYIGVGVSDLDAWLEFAGDVLGLQENGRTETGSVFLRMDGYHHRFELIPGGSDDIVHHGWEVKDAAALEQMAAQLRAYGLEVRQGTPEEAAQRMVVDLIKFDDPDGLPTEIYYGARLDHRPFRSPRGIKGFTADRLGLGHMVLAVKDPKAYIRFAVDALGARVSDYINIGEGERRFSLTFMHVNPRHHSLAIVGSAMGGGKRLNHFMIEVDSLDDVGLARTLFQQRGIMAGDFGRHTNDKMFSFYGQTPSGFMVEYGTQGLRIDDEDAWEVGQHSAASIWGHGMPRPATAQG